MEEIKESKYIEITVPDENDSMSSVTLDQKLYYLRFTYNDTFDIWRLSVYDSKENPIIEGIKIVPSISLNMFCPSSAGLPKGLFFTMTNLDRIGRNDFANGNAKFCYISYEDNYGTDG